MGGGESVFYREAPPRGPAPYPLYIIFDRKGVPFVFRWLTNDTPYTYLVFLSLSHTYKFAVFKMWINHKTRKFSRLFHSHKIHLLILLSIFTDRFDRFPFAFHILPDLWNPPPFNTWSLKKVPSTPPLKWLWLTYHHIIITSKRVPLVCWRWGGNPVMELHPGWGVEFRSRVDQRARLPLYRYILPTNTLRVWNYAIKFKVPTLTTIKSKARAGWRRSKIDIQVIGVWNLIGTLRYNGGESATATRTSKQQ